VAEITVNNVMDIAIYTAETFTLKLFRVKCQLGLNVRLAGWP
jgi:hypothetical protein